MENEKREKRRGASKSDSDKAEDEGVISGTAAKRGRDVASTGHTEQRDGKIAEGGHGLGSGTAADTASVFIEGDIADPVEAVFNRPMAATQTEQGLRTGMFGFKTGDAVNGFGAEFLRHDFRRFTLNGDDLGGVGKIQITVELCAGPDAADFDPAVAFIGCGVLRGEKTPSSGLRYLDGGWAGCLSR